DEKIYETGRKITDKELSSLNIIPCEKLGKWNYIVRPQL
ncbi:MAG: hypothetical protein II059_02055, partial [Clostridia bacterium]|nr:hypothetical protein [Clostridia bacterium]